MPALAAQIEDRLAADIAAGRLAPGERLPPERALAAQLGVSRMTLRSALGALERRGLLRRVIGRGGGTFVAKQALERDLSAYAGLSDQLRRQGLDPGARVLSARTRRADRASASALELPPGARVHEIVRVRLADGEPVALERTAFPAEAFPGLLDHPLDGSLYDVMRAHHRDLPRRAVERLEPALATPREAEALGVRAGAPLMLVERVAFGDDGTPLEFSRERYRGDHARVVVWIPELRA